MIANRTHLVPLHDLETVARQLWEELRPGAVVWLSGELGSGKTTFVRALTDVAGASLARSPTYALVHRYESPAGFLVHVDCYRLAAPDEALDLDLPGLQREARLLVIEWPEMAGHHAPPPDAHISFSHDEDPESRVIRRLR